MTVTWLVAAVIVTAGLVVALWVADRAAELDDQLDQMEEVRRVNEDV